MCFTRTFSTKQASATLQKTPAWSVDSEGGGAVTTQTAGCLRFRGQFVRRALYLLVVILNRQECAVMVMDWRKAFLCDRCLPPQPLQAGDLQTLSRVPLSTRRRGGKHTEFCLRKAHFLTLETWPNNLSGSVFSFAK